MTLALNSKQHSDSPQLLKQLNNNPALEEFSKHIAARVISELTSQTTDWYFLKGILFITGSSGQGYIATTDSCNCKAGSLKKRCWHRAAHAIISEVFLDIYVCPDVSEFFKPDLEEYAEARQREISREALDIFYANAREVNATVVSAAQI